jgi:hypothetical protein
MGGYAAADQRIRADHRASSYHQFTPAADYYRSEADPTPFFYTDTAPRRCRLMRNRKSHIFKCVVVIHNQYRRSENSIPSNINLVFRGHHTPATDRTTIPNYDSRFAAGGNVRDVQPDVLPETHAVT